jgi:hypothetical protein
MPLINLTTKKSRTKIRQIDTNGPKLSQGNRVHAFDVDHNKYHGTPHVHLNNGTVLNVFSGKIYKNKIEVGSMKKRELDVIRASIVENIISVAEGKFNLDGNLVFVHADKSDPQPTNIHVHSDSKTFSSDSKVYDVGVSNSSLKEFHAKLDKEVNSNSILSSLDKLYKNNKKNISIPDSLKNKLKTLVESSNISREYLKDKYGIDFESHDLDYF